MAKYDAASDELQKTTEEKKRLEGLPVYPNAKNLESLNQDKEEHQNRILDLQKKLSAMAIPDESISPQGFQDRLRTSVTNFLKKSADAGMKVAESSGQKFYMGFDVYQTKTPDDKLAPKLLRELKAIEYALNLLPDHRVDELLRVTRSLLPEEGGRKATPTPAPKGGAKKSEPAVPLVNRNAFEVQFRCEPGSLQEILNGLTTAKNQFYVVRNISIENTRQTPPSREEIAQKMAPPGGPADPGAAAPAPQAPGATAPAAAPATAPAAAPATPADPNAPAAPAAAPAAPTGSEVIVFVVGEERAVVTMLVEIADITPPPQPETKGKKK
jgi:hypothetical protein